MSIKLDKFNRITIDIDVDSIAKEVAESCAKNINQNIAKRGWDGVYKDTWEVTKRGNAYVCHSTKHQLAHLLENGHQIVNKKNGVGWSAPREHIRPAYEQAKKDLEQKVKKADIEFNIE